MVLHSKTMDSLVLTTQYLEEADQLANRISVIDQGSLIAEGTASDLKQRAGSEFITVQAAEASQVAQTAEALKRFSTDEPTISELDRRVTIAVREGSAILASVVRELDAREVAVSDLALRQPTLDDETLDGVFAVFERNGYDRTAFVMSPSTPNGASRITPPVSTIIISNRSSTQPRNRWERS